VPNGSRWWFRGGMGELWQHHLETGIRDGKQIGTARSGGTEQKPGDRLPLRPALIFLGEPKNDLARVGQSIDYSAVPKMDWPYEANIPHWSYVVGLSRAMVAPTWPASRPRTIDWTHSGERRVATSRRVTTFARWSYVDIACGPASKDVFTTTTLV
jgi:hypothetical protein